MSRARGFTLLEVIVALTVLGLILVPTLSVFSSGLRLEGAAEGVTNAVTRARSRLASVGIEAPLVEGETEGEFDDGSTWSIRIVREGDDEASDAADLTFVRYRIDVTVRPTADDEAGAVTLTTLRLAPPNDSNRGGP